jgi:hypothetical protein
MRTFTFSVWNEVSTEAFVLMPIDAHVQPVPRHHAGILAASLLALRRAGFSYAAEDEEV